MPVKIEKKIVGYTVANKAAESDELEKTESAVNTEVTAGDDAEQDASANVVHMHEKLKRPEMLVGSTYKIKTPLSEHALYVTIN